MRVPILPLVLLTGCPSTVIRDRSAYLAEVSFTDSLLRESAPAVLDFVSSRCTCVDGVWRTNGPNVTNQQCQSYVDWWLVYTARWAWHRRMMLFNSRVVDTRPGAAPSIPPVTCDLPTEIR